MHRHIFCTTLKRTVVFAEAVPFIFCTSVIYCFKHIRLVGVIHIKSTCSNRFHTCRNRKFSQWIPSLKCTFSNCFYSFRNDKSFGILIPVKCILADIFEVWVFRKCKISHICVIAKGIISNVCYSSRKFNRTKLVAWVKCALVNSLQLTAFGKYHFFKSSLLPPFGTISKRLLPDFFHGFGNNNV